MEWTFAQKLRGQLYLPSKLRLELLGRSARAHQALRWSDPLRPSLRYDRCWIDQAGSRPKRLERR